MTLLIDTSDCSLALRRDALATDPELQELKDALLGTDFVVTTGLVLQELLQGFSGPKARAQIIERFAALPLLPAISATGWKVAVVWRQRTERPNT